MRALVLAYLKREATSDTQACRRAVDVVDCSDGVVDCSDGGVDALTASLIARTAASIARSGDVTPLLL